MKDQQELQKALEDSRTRVGVAADDLRRFVGAALGRRHLARRAHAESVGNVTTFAFDPADPAFAKEAGWLQGTPHWWRKYSAAALRRR